MDESAEQGGTVGADEEPSSAHPTADELTAGASSRQPAIPSSQGGTEEQGYEAAEQEGNSGESAQGDEPVVGAPAEPALDRFKEELALRRQQDKVRVALRDPASVASRWV